MRKIISYGKLILGWPLSFVALLFIFRLIQPRIDSTVAHLPHTNWILLGYGVACFIIYYCLRSFLWREILASKNHHLTLQNSTFTWASAEIKRFVPGIIWSFLGRALLFSRGKVKTSTVVSGMSMEVHLILLSTLFLSFFSVPFVLNNFTPTAYYMNLWIILAIVFLVLGYLYLLHPSLSVSVKGSLGEKRFKKLWNIHDIVFPLVSFKVKLRLFLISVLTFFFFGLGTYLVAVSTTELNSYLVSQIIGFFVFSYFMGYIAIFAPLGLGVREGIIILGLSHSLPIAVAAFVALFARVVFIVSELLFFTSAYLWKRCTGKRYMIIETWIKNNKYLIIVLVLITMYVSYFLPVALLRYDNFYTGRFDLGNMDQTVWNTFRGRIFQLTDPDGTQILSRLALHADFILILLAPLYRIWPDPRMLLIVQTIVVSIGAIFVFLIAKSVLKSPRIGMVFALSYLLNPSVEYTNLYDFHGITLATTLLLGAFYFLLKKKWYLFFLFLLFAALCKEDVWLIVALFGLYLVFIDRTKKVAGGLLAILGALVFYYLIAVAIPHARGSYHFALSYYSDFGSSPLQIIKNIFFSPAKTFSILNHNGRSLYLLQLLLPVGFLSLASPLFMVFTIPDLFINLLSSNGQLHQIYFQYTASITPFLFIAAIYGVKRIMVVIPWVKPRFILAYLLIMTLAGAYFYGPLPVAATPNIDMITKPVGNRDEISAFLSKIKKRYSIAATNNIGSHLSRRQRIYTIPVGVDTADVVVFLLNDPNAQPSLPAQKQMVENFRNNPQYVVAYEKGDFIAFRKKNVSI